MAQDRSQLVAHQIPADILTTAETLARERVKHEYNRFGLNYKERTAKIKAGLVGELMFGRFLEKHGIPALFYLVIGQYDEGYDFRAGQLKIDVKTTTFQRGNKSLDGCIDVLYNKFHLYIADDIGQARKAGADLYVQAFRIDGQWCVLAGYSWGVPEATSDNPRNIFQARERPIPELEPIETLASLLEIQPVCAKCGRTLGPRVREVFRRGVGKVRVVDSVPEVMAESYRKHNTLYCGDCS